MSRTLRRPLCRRCAGDPCRRRRRRCKRTPLYALHRALGAQHGAVRRLRDAGAVPDRHPRRASAYARRRPGCSTSRIWARSGSRGAGCGAALEALVPGDLQALAPMRMRYTLLLNEAGGILDDLMATRLDGRAVARRQRRAQGGRPRASARSPRRERRRSSRSPTARCWRCRDRPPPRCCRASSTGIARLRVHDARPR